MFIDKSQFDPAPDEMQEAPKKTGFRRFLEIIQSDFLALIVLNLLFLVSCVPVITIPPALLAAHSVIRRMVLGEPVACWRNYWAAFRAGWKRSYGAFLLIFLPLAVGGYGVSFYLRHAQQSILLLFPFAFCAIVFWVITLASTYFYGFLCSGKPLKQAVRPALFLAVAKPLRAFLAALCWYGLPLLAILFFPLSGAYLAMLGFSLPFLLGSFYTRTVLKQFCAQE